MTEKKMGVFVLFAAAVASVAVASLFVPFIGLLYCVLLVLSFLLQVLVLRSTRPEVLRRGLSHENWWDRLLPPLMALLAAASAALSVYDVVVLRFSAMQSFLAMMGGVVLFMSSSLILVQSLRAQPPHGQEKYGEAAREGGERGPYEVVRHPMMLAVMLGGLSIPLFLGSGIGFIPAGLLVACVIIRTAAEDDWRFNNYEWFYDYTKEVSYRLIPFIW